MEKETPPPYTVTVGTSPPPPGLAPPPGFNNGHPGPQPSAGPYPPLPPQPQQVIFVNQPTLGSTSQSMMCPSCHQNISTKVESEPNSKTHMFALLLCLFGCLPCCCIPYCTDSCQSQKHSCPNCGAYLGEYSN